MQTFPRAQMSDIEHDVLALYRKKRESDKYPSGSRGEEKIHSESLVLEDQLRNSRKGKAFRDWACIYTGDKLNEIPSNESTIYDCVVFKKLLTTREISLTISERTILNNIKSLYFGDILLFSGEIDGVIDQNTSISGTSYRLNVFVNELKLVASKFEQTEIGKSNLSNKSIKSNGESENLK